MSGLLGLADSLVHKVKGTEHDDQHPADSKEQFLDGGIGDFGSAANGELTGRAMGGGLYGQKAGEQTMEPTAAERGEAGSLSDE